MVLGMKAKCWMASVMAKENSTTQVIMVTLKVPGKTDKFKAMELFTFQMVMLLTLEIGKIKCFMVQAYPIMLPPKKI